MGVNPIKKVCTDWKYYIKHKAATRQRWLRMDQRKEYVLLDPKFNYMDREHIFCFWSWLARSVIWIEESWRQLLQFFPLRNLYFRSDQPIQFTYLSSLFFPVWIWGFFPYDSFADKKSKRCSRTCNTSFVKILPLLSSDFERNFLLPNKKPPLCPLCHSCCLVQILLWNRVHSSPLSVDGLHSAILKTQAMTVPAVHDSITHG